MVVDHYISSEELTPGFGPLVLFIMVLDCGIVEGLKLYKRKEIMWQGLLSELLNIWNCDRSRILVIGLWCRSRSEWRRNLSTRRIRTIDGSKSQGLNIGISVWFRSVIYGTLSIYKSRLTNVWKLKRINYPLQICTQVQWIAGAYTRFFCE